MSASKSKAKRNAASKSQPSEIESSETEISAAQLAANRANARHSTGPRTPEGKARVARNAVKHGLFSREIGEVLELEPEEQNEFNALLAALLQDCMPGGQRENNLVHRLAALTWRQASLQRKILDDFAQPSADLGYDLKVMEAFGRIEARLSREMSGINRDLAFLQRYDDERRERADERAAERERANAGRSLEQRIEDLFRDTETAPSDVKTNFHARFDELAEVAALEESTLAAKLAALDATDDEALASAGESSDEPSEETLAAIALQYPDCNPREVYPWIQVNEQLRREREAKQTQTPPPYTDVGSSALT